MAEPTIGVCPRRHSHYTVQQDKLSDCGPSCISLLLHEIGHAQKGATIAEIRQMSAQYPGHYRPDRDNIRIGPAMASGSPLAALASLAYEAVGGYDPDEHYDGTFSGNLAQVLKNDFGIAKAKTVDVGQGRQVKDLLKAAGQPVIVHIRWSNGGGHFILGGLARDRHIIGKSEYCFSDPYYGLVSPTIGDKARNEYHPRNGVVGTFTGWVVTI